MICTPMKLIVWLSIEIQEMSNGVSRNQTYDPMILFCGMNH